MIELHSLTIEYGRHAGVVRPVDHLSVTLGPGSVALTGPSGSGKSSLLRVIAGLQEPTGGRVLLPGPVESVALIHQDYRLVEFLDVEDNLRLAAEARGIRVDGTEVARQLARVGLDGYEDRLPVTLSGGEQQRVAIARAAIARPTVLLADEPTGALDPANTASVARLLRAAADDHGLTVVVATHDPSVAVTMDQQLRLGPPDRPSTVAPR